MSEQKFTSGRGGKRRGAGRPSLPKELKAKTYSFVLYDWEVEEVKKYIEGLRKKPTEKK